MNYFIETYFQWPVALFSGLLCLVALYWLMVILSGVDLDLFDVDFDFDLDPDIDPSFTDFGMLTLRWLNLDEVPFMVWCSIMTIAAWIVAMIFDRSLVDPSLQESAIAIARNFGIGVLAAKLLTNPMRGKLRMKEPNTIRDMLGRTCSVITSEATPEFGHAMCHVEDGAPLQLNIRTLEGSVRKGDIVEIIDYAPDTGIYYVKETGQSHS